MKKEMQLQNYRKWIFALVVFISFISFYIYNVLTPHMSDDLMFDKSVHQTLGDIFRQEYISFMTHSGRCVLQMIMRFFMIFPKGVFDVGNSLCYVGTMLLIYWNAKPKKKYDVLLYALINLCVWIFCVDFPQTTLWVTGSCNYLWGIFIILGFITIYRFCLEKGTEIKNKLWAGVVLFVTGVLAGWCNENTSGGAILIVLLFTVKYYFENKKVGKVMISGMAGAFIGFAFMYFAPGNAARGELVAAEETYTGLAMYISRGLKLLKAIDAHLMLYMVVICLLGTYFYYTKKYSLLEFYEVAIYVLSALATAVVLIMTTTPMPRAYFGANIFMMIAALQMVQKIKEDDVLLISMKNGGIIAALLAMSFVYVEEGANLARIRREINTRDAYIQEEVEKGNRELILPMLRPAFESKYSMAHFVDISPDEENWNNDIYENKYGITILEVLPWDEWEEAVGISSGK